MMTEESGTIRSGRQRLDLTNHNHSLCEEIEVKQKDKEKVSNRT